MKKLNEAGVGDLILAYKILKDIGKKWTDFEAYKVGLIDKDGKRIKYAESDEEKKAISSYDKMILNLKRLLQKATGKNNLIQRIVSLFLLKESVSNDKLNEHVISKISGELLKDIDINESFIVTGVTESKYCETFIEAHEQEFINEAKQIGTIYHFTTLNGLKSLLNKDELNKFGCDILTFYSHNSYLSTTRNYALSTDMYNNDFPLAKYNVRIAIDGSKLSNKYKIKPVAGYTLNDKDIFNQDKNFGRVKRSTVEYEEVVCPLKGTKYFALKDYIIEIQILPSFSDIEDIDKLKSILKKLKVNIPINTGRKFKPLKESEYESKVFEMFDIIL